jgi:thiol-disulfide isomerase/thioredoxin
VGLTLALAACGGAPADRLTGGRAGGSGQNLGGQGGATGLTLWDPADRARLPKLAGRTLDGGRVDVSGWRGHVTVVNTWGSWCGPCRKEAPGLRRVAEDTHAAGVRFVGIDTRDQDAAARAFVREFAIGYPSIVDDEGRVMLALAQTVPVSAVPSTVVVDRRGRIAARIIGAVTYSTLRGLVDDLLAAKAHPAPAAASATAGPR